jgi:hypothetical protein
MQRTAYEVSAFPNTYNNSVELISDLNNIAIVRFQVLTAASMMFRIVFLDILPCKMIVNRRFRGAYCLHHQGWVRWRQYAPLKRRSTIILHGSISQKTTLNNTECDIETTDCEAPNRMICYWSYTHAKSFNIFLPPASHNKTMFPSNKDELTWFIQEIY